MDTTSGRTIAVTAMTTKAAMNLAAMMLVGETGLARLHASVPRSRSLEMSAIVAMTTISATV